MENQTPYILIVDDDEDDQHFLIAAIHDVIPGAIIKSLYDGTEAIKLFKSENADENERLPNLIFLDINMNKMGGKKTVGILKMDPRVQHIPMVILTTASSADQRRELLASGADDFYTKPYNIRDLKQIVVEIRQKWL